MPAIFSNPPLLALADGASDRKLLESAARIAPLLISSSLSRSTADLPANCEYWVQLDDDATVDQAIAQLDGGASKIVTRNANIAKEAVLPADRVLLLIDTNTATLLSDDVVSGISGILVEELPLTNDAESILSGFREALGGKRSLESKCLFFLPGSLSPSLSNGQSNSAEPFTRFTRDAKTKALPCLDLAKADVASLGEIFTSCLRSDRTDGLFTTVVASTSGEALGLVYSSAESLGFSLQSGDATYFSRSRNSLWKKGETSGATQKVSRIRIDCDADAVQFEVKQKQGTGFCHVPRSVSCFGHAAGLPALEATLLSRKQNAPKGSYTARLFSDAKMLNAKIREEADELCRAESAEDVASEAADLLYFALVRCIANGVSLADVGAVLDKRAGKVTRRPGHAKPAFEQQESQSQASTSSLPQANGHASPEERQKAMVNGLAATSKPQHPVVAIAAPQPNGALNSSDRIVPLKYSLADVDRKGRDALLQRPLASSDDMIARVRPIVQSIRTSGDSALRGYIKNFDRCSHADNTNWNHVLTAPFPPELMDISLDTRKNIDRAFANIHAFHSAQMDKERTPMVVETMPGVVCTRFIRPIDRVGLYVPGGTAVLPSTALMLAVPAQIAGCPFISLASPAGVDGNIRPEIVYIAHKCGVSQIVKAGGAQAVAAMAYGTESVGKVDKVFGPGNQWVTAAKMSVSMDSSAGVAIDMPAGPSEVLVIADKSAIPSYVAADLLSQAEHGPDSQVVLLAIDLDEKHLADIEDEINAQALALPRVDIARIAISKSLIVQCTSFNEAMSFSNDYAPEHLILHLENAREALDSVRNAGSVFVGPFSPESCGDYASGTNHTLPTAGYARQYSGVSTLSFCKHITSQELSPEGLRDLGPVVEQLAELESLHGHKNAVTVRLQTMKLR